MNVRHVMSLLLFVIIAVLVLGRASLQSTLVLEDTVELLRHAQVMGEGSLRDTLIVPSQVVHISVLAVLVNAISRVVGQTVSLLLLQFASVLILVSGLDGLLKVLGSSNRERWAILGMVALSPTILYWAIAVPPMVAALQVLGALLLAKKKWLWGLSIMVLAAFDGLLVSFVGLGLVMLLYKQGSIPRKYAIATSIIQLVIGLVSLGIFLFLGGALVTRGADLGSWVMEVGGLGGLSVVVMGLGLLGALVIYKRKYALEALLLISIMIASFVMEEAHMYAGLALAIIAGLFLSWLVSYRWELRQLRILSYTAIVLGIVGVVGVSCSQILWGQPDKDHVLALQEMEKILPSQAIVFAPKQWGFAIEVIANRSVVINARSPQERVQNLTQSILDEVYLAKLETVLKREGITHIYLPQDILLDRPDDDPEGGLVYLLQNAETFKNVYKDNGGGVWEYLHGGDQPRSVPGPFGQQ